MDLTFEVPAAAVPWVPADQQPLALGIVLGVIVFSFVVRWMNTLAMRFKPCPACSRAVLRQATTCPRCGGALEASTEPQP
ncbi:MAG: hypothetical protein VKS61_10410 [Candidatus Sericytochromatia bacterium]|nr:hypothetical protein [Candidatus Sericytochromatia bacterium]